MYTHIDTYTYVNNVFAKEPYKRDDILQKRPMNTPPEATLLYRSSTHVYIYTYIHTYTNAIVFSPNTRPEATCTYPSQHSTAKSSSSTTANQ